MSVQALIAKASVKRLDERIVSGFAGPRKVQRYLVVIRLTIQRFRYKFTTVVHLNPFRNSQIYDFEVVHHCNHIFAFQRLADMNGYTLTVILIDYR